MKRFGLVGTALGAMLLPVTPMVVGARRRRPDVDRAQPIHGSAPFCDVQYDGPPGECDENQFSVPTVAPTGRSTWPSRTSRNSSIQEGCYACATFIGDYNRIAFGSDGVAHVTWTDMRRPFRRAQNPPQYLQFIFYRSIPSERSSTGFRRSR